jgi:hypothetical protein
MPGWVTSAGADRWPGCWQNRCDDLADAEALRYRERMSETARTDVPVPVWLTLGSWDPQSEDLRDWVTARSIVTRAGAVYHFRHADLQDRLAERYAAGMLVDPTT